METTKSDTDRGLIGTLVAFAAAPRLTPAFVSVIHDGQLVLGGWLPPAGAARAKAGGRPGQRYAIGWSSLTEAELRVVRLVVMGFTNREIAGRLYLSTHTISCHLRHILQKLELRRRVDITRVALQHDPGIAWPAA